MNKKAHYLRRAATTGKPRGFTIVELLVGMILLTMIMGAIAMAMQGASDASTYGDEKSRSLNAATLAMHRLCTDVRRAATIQSATSRSITLTTADGEIHTYSWNGAAGGPLTLSVSNAPAGTLVGEVKQFSVTVTQAYSSITKTTVPVSVRIVLEAQSGDTTTKLQTSARVRRNIM